MCSKNTISTNKKQTSFISIKKANNLEFKFKEFFDGKLELSNNDLTTLYEKKFPGRDRKLHRFLSLVIIPSANVEQKSLVEELLKLKEKSYLVARDVKKLITSSYYFGSSENLSKSLLSSTRDIFCLYKMLVSFKKESSSNKIKLEKRLLFETNGAYNSLMQLWRSLDEYQQEVLSMAEINPNTDRKFALNSKRFLKAQRVFSIELQELSKVVFEIETTQSKCIEHSCFNVNELSDSCFSDTSSENLNSKLYGKSLELLADRLHQYSNKIRKNCNSAKFDSEMLNQLVTSSEEVLYLLKHEKELPVKSLEQRITVITEKADMISEKLYLFDGNCTTKTKSNIDFKISSSKKVSSKTNLASAVYNKNIDLINKKSNVVQEKSANKNFQQKLNHLNFLRRLHAKYHESSRTVLSENRTPLNPFSDTFSKSHILTMQQKIEIRDMLKEYLSSENFLSIRNKIKPDAKIKKNRKKINKKAKLT